MQLVEEATEGCWIGHRARMFTSEIGSVYSPPKQDPQALVETVIDIGHSERVRIRDPKFVGLYSRIFRAGPLSARRAVYVGY